MGNPLFSIFRSNRKKQIAFYPDVPALYGSFATGSKLDCKTVSGQYNAYVNCPPVATLITSKATSANNAIWWFGKEDSSKTSNQTIKEFDRLFKQPNQWQDWKRFTSLAYQMNQLYGKAYIYIPTAFGVSKKYAEFMLVIPNNYVTPIYDYSKQMISAYLVNMGGKSYTVLPEDMCVWNDFTFDLANANDYMGGQSRLFSLSDPVNIVTAAYEANHTVLTRHGMTGIISPDSANAVEGLVVPMSDDQKKQVQDDLHSNYGLQRNQWPLMITGRPIKYTQVGRPLRDLMINESIQNAIRQIAEAYRYPMYLLGFAGGTTFNNVGEAKKSLYSDAIIPEITGLADTLNSFLGNNSENKFRFDFGHIPEMQPSMVERENRLKSAAERLKIEIEAGFTTLQEAKDEMKELKS